MWKTVRVSILLLVLFVVGAMAWLDRRRTAAWNQTLWVGMFPMAADDSAVTQRYVADLRAESFAAIGDFFAREARRYGVALDEPVHIALYPGITAAPPARGEHDNVVATIWWSLRLRHYAAGSADLPGGAPAHIRVFVLYHDPARNPQVPHSLGLAKGLVGVVHAFASKEMTSTNAVVIAHETMHTLGATDKYDPATDAPLFPDGYGDPAQRPRYPQELAEIMAGRRALSPTQQELPAGLDEVVVGEATAREINWRR
jgi:hypothetical protein